MLSESTRRASLLDKIDLELSVKSIEFLLERSSQGSSPSKTMVRTMMEWTLETKERKPIFSTKTTPTFQNKKLSLDWATTLAPSCPLMTLFPKLHSPQVK